MSQNTHLLQKCYPDKKVNILNYHLWNVSRDGLSGTENFQCNKNRMVSLNKYIRKLEIILYKINCNNNA